MEDRAPYLRAGQVYLERDGVALLPRPQAAGPVGEHLGQHRLDGARHVHAGGAPVGLALERPAGPDVGRHVGDVHPHAQHALLHPAGRDRVVEVARVGRVDREGREVGEVHAGVGREWLGHGELGLVGGCARVGAAQAAVDHQALQHVARHVGPAQLAHHARAAPAGSHQDQVALAGAAGVHGRARPVAEQRLSHQEAPALAQHGHHRRGEPVGRPRPGRCVHLVFATSVSSAFGSASSARVRGLSRARTCGVMPFLGAIVFPPGR